MAIDTLNKQFLEIGVKHALKDLNGTFPDFNGIFKMYSWFMTITGEYDLLIAKRINWELQNYRKKIGQGCTYEEIEPTMISLRKLAKKAIASINTTVPIQIEREREIKKVDWRPGDFARSVGA